jgi:hypothetical protein
VDVYDQRAVGEGCVGEAVAEGVARGYILGVKVAVVEVDAYLRCLVPVSNFIRGREGCTYLR